MINSTELFVIGLLHANQNQSSFCFGSLLFFGSLCPDFFVLVWFVVRCVLFWFVFRCSGFVLILWFVVPCFGYFVVSCFGSGLSSNFYLLPSISLCLLFVLGSFFHLMALLRCLGYC